MKSQREHLIKWISKQARVQFLIEVNIIKGFRLKINTYCYAFYTDVWFKTMTSWFRLGYNIWIRSVFIIIIIIIINC